jgi:hypothetical protein
VRQAEKYDLAAVVGVAYRCEELSIAARLAAALGVTAVRGWAGVAAG